LGGDQQTEEGQVVSALVLTDFTADGVAYRKGQKITVPEEQYDQWSMKNLIGPTSDPTKVDADLIGPTSDGH
jgi:hypothetical protein